MPVQVASLPIQHHSLVREMVSEIFTQLQRSGGNDAGKGSLCRSYHDLPAFVQCYAPELEKRCRPHLKATTDSWKVDETYIKIKKAWTYLYRAVDAEGNTLEFLFKVWN